MNRWILLIGLVGMMPVPGSGQRDTAAPSRRSHEELLGSVPAPDRAFLPPAYFSPTPFPIHKVNPDSGQAPQNEVSVRINPTNVDNIVAAYRDFQLGWITPAVRTVTIATTTDAGTTWTTQFANYSDHNRFTDPGVGVDLDGNFSVATLDWREVNFNQEGTMVSVRRSTDGGLAWLPAVPVFPSGSSFDKCMIGVDDGPSSPYRNNIYVAWDGVVSFARSTDGGTSFELPADSPYVAFPSIATGLNGELYVVGYNAWGKVSTDGGVHFSDFFHSEDSVHPASYGIVISPSLWSLSEPVVGVDKGGSSIRAGTVYIVYPSLSFGDGDLFCVRSTDAGASWSPAVRVNNDAIANGRDQFHFWMTVDDSGFVDVVFLDRRNDPNNILCDAYFAQSRDGGRSFRNFRITPQNFDPRITPNGEVRLGEYIGIDARRNRIVPSWVDTHLGNQDIYIAVIDQDSTATIRGRVSGYDALQVSGIALLLLHDNGIDSAFADSTGYYQFDGLFPGTYTLRLQDGFVGTPDTVSISLASGETVADRDFHIISTGIAGDGNPTPRGYSLSPNYPNPFNSVTRISYSLPSASHVSLRIYDVLGRGIVTLVDERKTVGRHTVEWNAAGVPSGVYFYRLAADGFLETKEMVLSK